MAALLSSFLPVANFNYSPTFASPRASRRCNAYTEPGFVANTHYPKWKTFDPACDASEVLPDLLRLVPSAANGVAASQRSLSVSDAKRAELERTLSNRTILLVGDAVDRSMVQGLCVMLGQQSVAVDARHAWGQALNQVPLSEFEDGVRRDPGDELLADYCYEPTFDLFVTSFYHYGIDTNNVWRKQASFYPPGLFESRVNMLLGPYLNEIKSNVSPMLPRARAGVDLAVFSSSFWDLAAWATEDAERGVSASSGLGEKRLTTWRSRAVDMIEALRTQIGSARLAWRSAHIPASGVRGTTAWFVNSLRTSFEKSVPKEGNSMLSALRIAQLNEARRSMLPLAPHDAVKGAKSGTQWSSTTQPAIGNIPFGEVTLGQDVGQNDIVHPGVVPHAYLFWDMAFDQLRG